MEKINFEDGVTKANATTFNQLETNVENAIDEVDTKVNGIIESGSNDNGSYIKYADGTMICNKTLKGTVDITSNTMSSAFCYGLVSLGDTPQAFIERPTIVVSPQTQSGTQYFLAGSAGGLNGSATSFGQVSLLRPASKTGVAYILDVIAIGRWKTAE